jgi:hypothetical protein
LAASSIFHQYRAAVSRPSTDDPQMISAMTSLTFVRTKLLEFLFARPPYADLRDMLDFFRDAVDIEGAHGVAHLQTVSASFENLLRVFQKTTLSPGIKAFHDVREIVDNGQFVIQTNVPLDRMLCLEYQHVVAAAAAAAGGSPTAAATAAQSPAASAVRPNLVIINIDDLGYADIGPFGSKKKKTPRLDRMAAEGRVFTSFYAAAPLCSPSRAALMTGSYPRRVGLGRGRRRRQPHVLFCHSAAVVR